MHELASPTATAQAHACTLWVHHEFAMLSPTHSSPHANRARSCSNNDYQNIWPLLFHHRDSAHSTVDIDPAIYARSDAHPSLKRSNRGPRIIEKAESLRNWHFKIISSRDKVHCTMDRDPQPSKFDRCGLRKFAQIGHITSFFWVNYVELTVHMELAARH